MPVGGKLKLKGGQTIGKPKKKSKRKQEGELPASGDVAEGAGKDAPPGISVQSNKTYEEEFASEIERAKQGKAKSTPWGSGFSAAPEILHGYTTKVTGRNAEERLDMRCARKTDKFCNGKSCLAAKLAKRFEQAGQQALIVDESILMMDKNKAYADAAAEKNTRASFKAEVDRKLSRNSVVILDTLNNIKGFRYEMWCIARAAATRSCVLHCDVAGEQCREWNSARTNSPYSTDIFNDLVGRFERPDTRNRWDSPLFETRPGDENLDKVLDDVVQSMLGTGGVKLAQPARELNPSFATAPPAQSTTNLLSEIDHAAQSVISTIVEAQTASGGAAGRLSFADGIEPLALPDPVPLAVLRRHKRTFMKLATQNAFSQIRSADAATRIFVSYLRDQLQP